MIYLVNKLQHSQKPNEDSNQKQMVPMHGKPYFTNIYVVCKTFLVEYDDHLLRYLCKLTEFFYTKMLLVAFEKPV